MLLALFQAFFQGNNVIDNLKGKVTLVEEDIIVELMEMEKGESKKTILIFTGMNLHSYCSMLCPGKNC